MLPKSSSAQDVVERVELPAKRRLVHLMHNISAHVTASALAHAPRQLTFLLFRQRVEPVLFELAIKARPSYLQLLTVLPAEASQCIADPI
eukprot:IDg16044t1